MKNILKILLCLTLATPVGAQDTTATVQFSGYLESFYSFDFNQPPAGERTAFLYSFNRHNEFNINLGFVKAAYSARQVRANFAYALGTYMADNYAAEPVALRNILEANAGFQLSKNVWLDAGILPSHIGFESAIGKDCPTLSRSLAAENSPYFETGARLTITPDSRWTVALLALNGWQRIARVNTAPAVGSQLMFKPNDKITLNWSTYFGSERPDSIDREWRFFNDFYGIFQLSKKMQLTLGCDIGAESGAVWFAPQAVWRTKINEKWALAARVENYTDRDGVIIAPDVQVLGASVNLDFSPAENALLRFETRWLGEDDRVFPAKNSFENNRLFFTTSLAVGF